MDDLDPILVQRASQAATRVRTAPFTLYFDRLTMFNGQPENPPLVIATDAASNKPQEIAAELHTALRAMGITASRSQKVNPHVTLAYGPGFSGERHRTKPIAWTISEIRLIDSLHGQGRRASHLRRADRRQDCIAIHMDCKTLVDCVGIARDRTRTAAQCWISRKRAPVVRNMRRQPLTPASFR